MPIAVVCTACGSQLKLKDASYVGKKVRCPKCQEPFVVKAPAGAQRRTKAPPLPTDDFPDDLDDDDFGEDFGDDFGEEIPAAPARKSKSSGRKSKRRKSGSGSGGKIALIAGIAVLVLLLVGGIGWGVAALVQNLGGAANRMAWLPDDSEIFIEVHVADAWESQALSPLRNSDAAQKLTEQIRQEVNMQISDIDRVVVGSSSTSPAPLVVTYCRRDINTAEFEASASKSDYNGATIYEDKTNRQHFFLPDSRTIVTGPEAMVKSAIDRNGVCAATERFGSLPRGDVVVVLIGGAMERPRGAAPGMAFDPSKLDRSQITVDFGRNIDIDFDLKCTDAATAGQIATDMQSGKTEAVANLQEGKNQLQPNMFMDEKAVNRIKSLMGAAEQTLNSLSVSSSGADVEGSVTIPGSVVADLAAAGSEINPAMMLPFMQMMNQPARPTSPPPSFSLPPESP